MNILLRGTLGALALAAAALPTQAATPLTSAVFHPDATPATVQTVQYYSHYHPHHRFHRRPFFHHRPFYGHGPRPYGAPAPFRHY